MQAFMLMKCVEAELEGVVLSTFTAIFQLVISAKSFGYPIFHPQIPLLSKAGSKNGKSCIQKYKISMILQWIEDYFLVWFKYNI